MTVAAVVLAAPARPPGRRPAAAAVPPATSRRGRPGPLGAAAPAAAPAAAAAARAAAAAGLDEVVVVVADERLAAGLPEDCTVLLDEAAEPSECSSLRAALDWCGRSGHAAAVVAAVPPAGAAAPALADPASWKAAATAAGGPVSIAAGGPGPRWPVRLAAEVWPLLPLAGELAALWRSRPELVSAFDPVLVTAQAAAPSGPAAPSPPAGRPAPDPVDVDAVTALLGRPPAGAFRVAVRAPGGEPVVIENAPLLDDGTPMPTRWWLVGTAEREAVSRLESRGGVAEAEAAVPAAEVAAAHERYAAGRDALAPAGHRGPLPSGGVGGTRRGVKCLHAHLAAYLAGTGDPVGRWTARRLAGSLRGPLAALDCGTNSTRLLVCTPGGSELERRMTITRLGEGVDERQALAEAAIRRTLAALAQYREALDRHGVVRLRATATSAARDARNAADLLIPAGELLGVPLEVLSAHEEGVLSYRGATAGLDPAGGPFLVVDLGGGSTELVAPGAGTEVVVVSLAAGCVRMTERFLRGDPPSPASLAAARSAVLDLVAGALAAEPALGEPAAVVGAAGTVTSLAALRLGIAAYDPARTHHSVLSRDDVEGLLAELAATPLAQRRRRRPLEPGRADVIVGGAVVLAALLEALDRDSLLVSEADGLDGLAATLVDR